MAGAALSWVTWQTALKVMVVGGREDKKKKKKKSQYPVIHAAFCRRSLINLHYLAASPTASIMADKY